MNHVLKGVGLIGIGLTIGLQAQSLGIIKPPNEKNSPAQDIILASMGTNSIKLQDIENTHDVLQAKFDADQAYYEAQQTEVNARLDEWRLQQEAQHQNMTTEALLKRNASPPKTFKTDAEMFAILVQLGFEGSEAKIMKDWKALDDETQEEKRQEIEFILGTDEAKLLYKKNYLAELAKRYPANLQMLPPRVPDALRVDVKTQTRLVKGDAAAPITIEEFSDPRCGFCRKVQDTLHKLDTLYPGQIRWVYHHNLLDSDEESPSFKLAEAAFCAADQQKFWEYNDVIYHAEHLDNPKWSELILKAGLDANPFMACVNDHRYREQVKADLSESEQLEFAGTPAFLINGIKSEGAMSEEEFKAKIDVELKNAPHVKAVAEANSMANAANVPWWRTLANTVFNRA